MSKYAHGPTSASPTIHITILLILSLLILIGPSRILSDSSLSSTCPQIYVTNPQSGAYSPLSSSTTTPSAKPWDATHIRLYNDSQALLATHKSSLHPEAWESMLIPTKNGGIVINGSTVEHIEDYPPMPAHNKRELTAAVILVPSAALLVFKENSFNDRRGHGASQEYFEWHTAHCFEYIAQMIMCAADDTIEKPKKVIRDGKAWWGVDGVGTAHQCKDPRPLCSEKEPVDLSRWQDGIGAREYF